MPITALLRFLQANINHCACAQDLLLQSMAQWSVNIAVVAEPYFVLPREDWVADLSGSVTMVSSAAAGTPTLESGGVGDGTYCNATCDGYLCWPATPAGETIYQNCPSRLLSNEKNCALRRCGPDGQWLGRHFNETSSKGWTNFTPCFPPLVQQILDKVNEDEAEAQLKFETAVNTRIIEMVGIVSSFVTICAAIVIFNAFSSLHNRRTVIHKNLFYGLFMEVTIRLILYTQQSYSFDVVNPQEDDPRKGIEYFPYVCEGAYVFLEYSRLVVYGWMFIEGIFLNSLVSANALRNEIPINYFYVGGWGVPVILSAIWATVVARHYSKESINTCWYGYNYLPSYYIIQGPILAVVLINFLFLGTIMSVIIMKLRRTNDSELRKIQKTLRATLILLPLLGIINIFNLFDYPLDGSAIGFAIWAYFTHFFRSFQGVFISVIYCFSNGEVRKALMKKWERRTWLKFERRRINPPVLPRDCPIFTIGSNENVELVPMQVTTWNRSTSTQEVTDTEAGTEASAEVTIEATSHDDTEKLTRKILTPSLVVSEVPCLTYAWKVACSDMDWPENPISQSESDEPFCRLALSPGYIISAQQASKSRAQTYYLLQKKIRDMASFWRGNLKTMPDLTESQFEDDDEHQHGEIPAALTPAIRIIPPSPEEKLSIEMKALNLHAPHNLDAEMQLLLKDVAHHTTQPRATGIFSLKSSPEDPEVLPRTRLTPRPIKVNSPMLYDGLHLARYKRHSVPSDEVQCFCAKTKKIFKCKLCRIPWRPRSGSLDSSSSLRPRQVPEHPRALHSVRMMSPSNSPVLALKFSPRRVRRTTVVPAADPRCPRYRSQSCCF